MANLLKQLRWFKLVALLYGIATVAFFIYCGITLNALGRQAAILHHTNEVLEEVLETEISINAADSIGTAAILAPQVTGQADAARSIALAHLDKLRHLALDNPRQTANIDAIRTAVTERWAAQDAQISTVERTNGSLKFDLGKVAEAMRTNAQIKATVSRTRIDERALLTDRTTGFLDSLTYSITGVLTSAFVSMVSCLILFSRVIRELNLRQDVSDLLTTATEMDGERPQWLSTAIEMLDDAEKRREGSAAVAL